MTVPLILFLAALAVRLIYVLLWAQTPVQADAISYDLLGWNLVRGLGLVEIGQDPSAVPVPNIYWSPGYPFFLSLVYTVAGHDYAAVRVAQAALSALVAPVCWWMGRTIGGPLAGLMASILFVLDPGVVFYTGSILTEQLGLVLFALATAILISAVKTGSAARYAAGGVLTGIAALTRAEALLYPVVLSVVLLGLRCRTITLGRAALLCATPFLTLLPWTVRNYVEYHALVPTTTHFGDTFWVSTLPLEQMDGYLDLEMSLAGDRLTDPIGFDRTLRQEAINNIIRDPASYALLSMRRVASFWIGSHTEPIPSLSASFADYLGRRELVSAVAKGFFLLVNTGFVVLGIIGAVYAWRRFVPTRALTAVPLVLICYIASVHTLLWSAPRYQIPLHPEILVFAGTTIAAFVGSKRFSASVRQWRRRQPAVSS